jgi:hypothetical protein
MTVYCFQADQTVPRKPSTASHTRLEHVCWQGRTSDTYMMSTICSRTLLSGRNLLLLCGGPPLPGSITEVYAQLSKL